MQANYIDDADVLYNKFNFNLRWSSGNCIVDTGRDYWRKKQCTDEHRVVCQSG